MESDLISRSAVLEIINEVDISDCTDVYDIIDRAYADVASAPIVDAVPVVRCKECCYLAKDGESLYCTYHDNINVTEKFFCATGEVRHADARKPV